MYLLLLLELGIWSPRNEYKNASVVRPRAPRWGEGSKKRGYNSSLSDRVIPTLVPLRSIHWKIFPDLLTSQPCHLPTAAWIQNAALNPCPAGKHWLSWRAIVLDCTVFSFFLIFACVFALFLLFFFNRGEKGLSILVWFYVCLACFNSSRVWFSPELFICW